MSSICVTNNAENTTTIEENQVQQSSIETITIDDTQPETIVIETATTNKPIDPWIPISDEIDEALERAIDEIGSSSDTPLEYTPVTARRTDTEIMAARLPKIPLKEGRFRNGKPIPNRTIFNAAADEYRPSKASPPTSSAIRSSPPTSSSAIQSSPPTSAAIQSSPPTSSVAPTR